MGFLSKILQVFTALGVILPCKLHRDSVEAGYKSLEVKTATLTGFNREIFFLSKYLLLDLTCEPGYQVTGVNCPTGMKPPQWQVKSLPCRYGHYPYL